MAEHIIHQANAFAFELEAAARHAEVAGAYVRMAGNLAAPGQTVVLAQAAAQLALALYAVAAPLVDAEACAGAAEPCTLPLFGEAA